MFKQRKGALHFINAPYKISDRTLTGVSVWSNAKLDAIRLKHYSDRTEKSYLQWIKRYVIFHQKRPIDIAS